MPLGILLKGGHLLPNRRGDLCVKLWSCLLAGILGAVLPASAEPISWRDIESRIQYSYYVEDASALRHLNEAVSGAGAQDRLRGYYAGLLAWRLAQLAEHAKPAAGDTPTHFAQQCVTAVDTALAIQADFAEALALRSACLATPMETDGAHAPFAARRARRDLERALQLAPRNPRVLLLDAMGDYGLAPDQGGNKDRALPKLRQAVAAFEAERRDNDPLPGWGAAEAWLLLARDLLDQGDPVASRDALEHALLIAPEYAQARRLLTKITAG
jgi:tetratricopeptide (TPR) repeat protein